MELKFKMSDTEVEFILRTVSITNVTPSSAVRLDDPENRKWDVQTIENNLTVAYVQELQTSGFSNILFTSLWF